MRARWSAAARCAAIVALLAVGPDGARAQPSDEAAAPPERDAEAAPPDTAGADEPAANGANESSEADQGETSARHAEAEPAEDPPEVRRAREHLARGTRLLDQENYDAALAEFERAYELVGDHPFRYLILFNVARAHERRFRYDLALAYYRRYLEEGGPEAEHRAEVRATMRTLEGLLADLEITTNVEGAEVWVDDRRVGTAPGTVRVPGGRHVVELRAPGYADARRQVQLTARETVPLSLELEALAEEYRGISPVFFWGSAALAVGAGLAGGAVGIAAVVRRSDVDGQLADPVGMLDGGALEAARGDLEDLQLTADLLFGTAGLFAATALVLAFLTDWGAAPEAEADAAALELAPALAPGALGLAVRGRL